MAPVVILGSLRTGLVTLEQLDGVPIYARNRHVVESAYPGLGGRRLIQRATGYDLTMIAGEIVSSNGEPTGVLPGRLIRAA